MKRIECPYTKEELHRLYVQDGFSLAQIAKLQNITNLTLVRTWLKRYEIPTRAFTTKGLPSAFRGKQHTQEAKEKNRVAHLGKKQSFEQRLAHKKWMLVSNPFLGKKHSEATKELMRNVERKFTPEGMQGVLKRMNGNTLTLGRKATEEQKLKLSLSKRGAKHPNWNPDRKAVLEGRQARKAYELQLARQAALVRDEYRCVLCGATERLEVDHIKTFKDHPELRTSIENLRTLCHKCHIRTSTYGGHSKKKLSA